ncbi:MULTISPECIES: flagellar hook-associated protein FlgK [Gammaproteobacteria]|uniref:flagellar hook-associated protein FlgK n=1 Tax=Gammaproteobacteria TaxID=1236 RepID=UPI000DCFB816|nr:MULTISPECIES: flagellar hook-associated protein FlgK [Gammaproteobacteria]RTE86156.1 flagellar hook-associated protein FlgK [Aliidiomarina sp. B3213]TCZ91508.1 flagellar hook-associated protein FlgK [Lysobacter sp. N42]
MSFDLIRIGTQATQGHQRSLQVTGNNIANINTPGYVRERSVYQESPFGGGINRVEVERLLDKFTQRQYWTDTSRNGYTKSFLEESGKVDTMLGNDEANINSAITKFFAMMQDLNDDPASITQRDLVLGQADSTLAQIKDMNSYLNNQQRLFNEKLELTVSKANTLAQSIGDINKQLDFIRQNASSGERHTLLNERDEKIRELSELVNVSTLEDENGRLRVNLSTGQALVLEDGTYNLMALKGEPDQDRPELVAQIRSGGNLLEQGIDELKVGGQLGGLLAYRAEVLEPTQMKLGQLALGFADAINEQQQLGMDLDDELGSPMFSFNGSQVSGVPFPANTGTNQQVNVNLVAGELDKLVANNFEIEMLTANTYRVMPVDYNGDIIGNPGDYPTYTVTPPNGGGEDFGLTIDFAGGTFAAGDRFLVKPTKNAADNIQLAFTRPEDIALASPVRVTDNANNGGQGTLELEGLSATGNFFTGNALSNAAPVQINYLGFTAGQHNLEIVQNDGTVITHNTADMNDLFGQIPALGNADYEVSLKGKPNAGDVFTIEYNTGAINDNSNGLALAELQRERVLRRNPESITVDNTMTLTEGYGRLVSDVGNKVSQARTADVVSGAMLEQSKQFYESSAGVSLEEEAANLIQYEQAYNASARIITIAQQIFDTLLNSTR